MKRGASRPATTARLLAGAASAGLAVALLSGASPAEDGLSRSPLFVAFDGDPQAGQRVAMGAGGAGVAGACVSCHGPQGAGDAGAAFPRLAGQPAFYLYKQLVNYADGTRPHEAMTPIALRLSERERRDVAAYYAAARAPHREPPARDPQALQLGGAIAAQGAAREGVQACNGCHGPGGGGMGPDVPYLAGQGAAYLELQLRLWKEGRRRNDPQGVMADLARRLSPEQHRALADYFAALPPPAP